VPQPGKRDKTEKLATGPGGRFKTGAAAGTRQGPRSLASALAADLAQGQGRPPAGQERDKIEKAGPRELTHGSDAGQASACSRKRDKTEKARPVELTTDLTQVKAGAAAGNATRSKKLGPGEPDPRILAQVQGKRCSRKRDKRREGWPRIWRRSSRTPQQETRQDLRKLVTDPGAGQGRRLQQETRQERESWPRIWAQIKQAPQQDRDKTEKFGRGPGAGLSRRCSRTATKSEKLATELAQVKQPPQQERGQGRGKTDPRSWPRI